MKEALVTLRFESPFACGISKMAKLRVGVRPNRHHVSSFLDDVKPLPDREVLSLIFALADTRKSDGYCLSSTSSVKTAGRYKMEASSN